MGLLRIITDNQAGSKSKLQHPDIRARCFQRIWKPSLDPTCKILMRRRTLNRAPRPLKAQENLVNLRTNHDVNKSLA